MVVHDPLQRCPENHQFPIAEVSDEDRVLRVITLLHATGEHLISTLIVGHVVGHKVSSPRGHRVVIPG
jgi:hypothetical protein